MKQRSTTGELKGAQEKESSGTAGRVAKHRRDTGQLELEPSGNAEIVPDHLEISQTVQSKELVLRLIKWFEHD